MFNTIIDEMISEVYVGEQKAKIFTVEGEKRFRYAISNQEDVTEPKLKEIFEYSLMHMCWAKEKITEEQIRIMNHYMYIDKRLGQNSR
ncbi:hypothetical protein [Bacillus solitudinis]|uniref:hypothetical protein n=1 Tax=Bacillus solitudinis TaxID=2014074 RepID=UPI000C24A095|nr:hypothetical protein [Bacillus solitudinis]